ncbi:hypothetical protein ABKN59_001638 [Abortiporus biennis]
MSNSDATCIMFRLLAVSMLGSGTPCSKAINLIASSHPPLKIPRELADNITDFLWNDKKALLATSIISRIFHASSRYHLFSQLVVDGSHLEHDISNFALFLRRRPEICPYVHSLSLKLMYRGRCYPKSGGWRVTDLSIIAEILELIPFLHHLTLRGLEITPWHRESPQCLHPFFKLVTLKIINVTFQSNIALDESLGLFTEVEHLEIEGSSLRNPPMDPSTSSCLEQRIKTQGLHVSDVDLRLTSTNSQSLRTLRLKHLGVSGIDALGTLLRDAGGKLVRLSLPVKAIADALRIAPLAPTPHLNTLHLDSCPSLTEIVLCMEFAHGVVDHTPIWETTLGILFKLTTNLRRLIMVFSVKSDLKHDVTGILQSFNWTRFQQTVSRFNDLEHIEVQCDSKEKAGCIENFFIAYGFLPQFRDLVRVRHVEVV